MNGDELIQRTENDSQDGGVHRMKTPCPKF